ncbi:hypothetical protein LOTGIDRAFT_171918 [Lottia gigantea]|uniref:Antistasin-like domain-containing protein n=1 Tax=Lottia gigantea TaxID=225164 RepID=V4B516_LOTGI|nr:hypothetical protein LOTGIDRAFT_171918 [Lottia gigantea]ESP02596.1 hypothetical protein LOTGIDRAFT_171918 [Lottia gigantea]
MNIAVCLSVVLCLLHSGQALDPAPVCPQVKCSTICKEYVYEDGCQTCTCKACEPVLCKMYCANGWALNEDGCEICKCKPCKPVLCRMYCRHGWAVNEDGCEICKCKKCEPVLCKMKCPYGWAVGKDGCEICKCKMELPCDGASPLQNKDGKNLYCGRGGERCPDNSYCEIHPTDLYAVCCSKCSPVLCDLYCKNGFKVDNNGCETCSCRQCPKGVELVSCFTNPCNGAICSDPSAKTCKANYCGGCNAVWYDSNNEVVSCNTKG